ncbi:MAG: hypothetical protein ABIQ51_10085, partial [Mesorhizobium sp.]
MHLKLPVMPTGVADTTAGFPSDWQERWRVAHQRIDHAGYGDTIARNYRRAGPHIAERVGPAAAIRLGGCVSATAIRAGRRAAGLLIDAALHLTEAVSDPSQFMSWLDMVDEIAKRGPESLAPFLENLARLLDALGFPGLLAFVRMGLGVSRQDKARRLAFFSLESGEARRLLDNHARADALGALTPRLKPYFGALWGFCPPIAEPPADAPEIMRRRSGFGGGGIRLPPSYAGFASDDQEQLYRASLAHIGAHHRFTRGRFPAVGLRPLQIAIVSLIEDARAELLAMREMPGLFDLWSRFHVARPEGAPVAISLMARLSRGLLDPAYEDPHGWVAKGRALFDEAISGDPHDQQLSRRIGGLLGNDIGQMRLQFDAKTYVVQPAYRDDNLAIWDFGDQSEPPTEIEAMAEGARIEQQSAPDGRKEEGEGEEKQSGRLRDAGADGGTFVARYPEYDHVTGQFRPDWCTVREWPPKVAPPAAVNTLRESRSDLVERISKLIRSSRVSRQERVRRQPEGEFLDMDA